MAKTLSSGQHQHTYNEHGMCSCGTFQDRAVDKNFHELADDPQEFNLDDFSSGGFTFRGKPIADLDQVTDQIWTGRTLDPGNDNVITFSFYNAQHGNGWFNSPGIPKLGGGTLNGGNGMSPFSPTQEAAARIAIQMWDDLIPQSFAEVNGHGGGVADIVFANSADPAQAFAYYPGNYRGYWDSFTSDVFIADPKLNWTNEWFTPGGYGNTTLVHELGHSMGLSHPGAYNGAGATNYINQAEYAQDSMQYSIMSYWSGGETGASTVNWTLFLNNYAQTPMLHDIYAIQQAYGADMTTRTGDTVYGFNSNAGYDIYDFAYNPYPYLSIWDAGGNDTIDLSGFNSSNYLNLNEGTFSSVGQAIPTLAEVNADRAAEGFGAVSAATFNSVVNGRLISVEAKIEGDTGVDGVYASGYDNLSIAYGVTIENGIGGQARDVIIGNQVDNIIDGQGGDDVLLGGDGDDIIIGGMGFDEMLGEAGADTFVLDNLDYADVIYDFNGGEGDTLDLSGIADILGTDLTFIGDAAFSGAAGEVRYDGFYLEVSAGGDTTGDYTVVMANSADLDATMMVLAA